MEILPRDTLARGGFAGLKETRLIHDIKIGGNADTWNGIGNFVYLADARYLPHGETHLHSHLEVDVITVLLEGRLTHEGSLDHGQSLQNQQVQVQRAGGEGFEHNEINPDLSRTRLLQLWALPETPGEAAEYKLYDLNKNQLMRIYGGKTTQHETFDSHTIIEVGLLDKGCHISKQGEFLAYITNGKAEINGAVVEDGDLIRADSFDLKVTSNELHLTLISVEKDKAQATHLTPSNRLRR